MLMGIWYATDSRSCIRCIGVVAELGGLDVSGDVDRHQRRPKRTTVLPTYARPRSQNNANSHKARAKLYSAVKGVSYDKGTGQWVSHCTINNRTRQRRFNAPKPGGGLGDRTRKALHGNTQRLNARQLKEWREGYVAGTGTNAAPSPATPSSPGRRWPTTIIALGICAGYFTEGERHAR